MSSDSPSPKPLPLALAPPPEDPRFRPRAAGAMAEMFDDVSGRYDFLNRLMTLGRDQAWRREMWERVPESARTVLDLCTGSGVSLDGLRRPGRLAIGLDVSLRMLENASEELTSAGWAPRLVCADVFRLPLPDGSVDAVTIAFGIRNLRPRPEALAEIARVLEPGGVLVVLEGTGPRPGPLAPFHRFWLARVVPLLGRLSPDPGAYAYLGQSILDFGPGDAFERELVTAGFVIDDRRTFLLGATRLWSAWRGPAAADAGILQPARVGEVARGEMRIPGGAGGDGWRWWVGVQLALSAALVGALAWALRVYFLWGERLPLERWQRSGLLWLLWGGAAVFALRTVVLWLRFVGPKPRR
jgi:demethylmenaquinone methyltransferase/2-methoxy-6-polyprenyl-1,4-benzoquinol methylase